MSSYVTPSIYKKSNFKKVCEFNKAFGVKSNTVPQTDLYKKDPGFVKYRLDLISEEANELVDAIKNEDFIETVDAITDLLYVVYGAATAFGICCDKVFDKMPLDNTCRIYKKSNFQKVCEFNKAFAIKSNNEPQFDLYKKDPALVKCRLDLILEEVNQLTGAIKDENFIETEEALTDLLYVVYGAATAFGFDADKAFDIVHESNMSKLCKTEVDAIETVKRYTETPIRYDSPNYRKSEDDIHWVVYNESTQKILKNYKYKRADFSSILNL
jgi:predicted HAD superfamily Cof-like phosphohydrolase